MVRAGRQQPPSLIEAVGEDNFTYDAGHPRPTYCYPEPVPDGRATAPDAWSTAISPTAIVENNRGRRIPLLRPPQCQHMLRNNC